MTDKLFGKLGKILIDMFYYHLARTIFSLIFLSVISNCFFISSVSAHVLKTDGTIGAIMHIDPDDDPQANSPASFFFQFKDKDDKFNPANCSCIFTVWENGQSIYSQPLFENNPTPSLENASLSYTFPRQDVYQIEVNGKPNLTGQFQPFNLIYNVRVDQTADNSNQNLTNNWFVSHLALEILGSGFLIGLIFALIIKSKNNKIIETHKK